MSETNSYKKATDSPSLHPRLLSFTDAQLIQIELALDDHIADLERLDAGDPGMWAEEIETARQALVQVRGV
jgi:hypothetical protein